MNDPDNEAVGSAAGASTKYLRAQLRLGEIRKVMRDLRIHPELDLVPEIARRFAILLAEEIGDEKVNEIDHLNELQRDRSVCHSRDFCDANRVMQKALHDVAGIDATQDLETEGSLADRLWDTAWKYAKIVGFRKLSAIRGVPDMPPLDPIVRYDANGHRSMEIVIPGLNHREVHPLAVSADYWGRNPRLQFLCYEYAAPDGEPKVCVRYDQHGKIDEVLVGNVTLIRGHGKEFVVRPYVDTDDTPWEIERDSNPPCDPGDRLQMPSGQIATVIRLRDRYDNDFEKFKAYAETYGILDRLNGYPGSEHRNQVYESLEQAWDVNPLTAGTTDPRDFSIVPLLNC